MQDLKIALIQFAPEWENPSENIKRIRTLIEAVQEADILLLPEMFLSGFTMHPEAVAINRDSSEYRQLQDMAEAKNCVICGSVIWSEGGTYTNRFLWIEPNASIRHYDKRHLFAFAGEDKVYTRGKNPILIEYKGWKIAPFICYDLRFPVFMRRRENLNYDLILLVASWPERRSLAWQCLLPARAIENQCYVAAVNRVGQDGNGILHEGLSQMLNFKGQALAEAGSFRENIVEVRLSYAALEEFRRRFAFYADGDRFEILD